MKKSNLKVAIKKVETLESVDRLIDFLGEAVARKFPINFTIEGLPRRENVTASDIENIPNINQSVIRKKIYTVLIDDLKRVRRDLSDVLESMGVEL